MDAESEGVDWTAELGRAANRIQAAVDRLRSVAEAGGLDREVRDTCAAQIEYAERLLNPLGDLTSQSGTELDRESWVAAADAWCGAADQFTEAAEGLAAMQSVKAAIEEFTL